MLRKDGLRAVIYYYDYYFFLGLFFFSSSAPRLFQIKENPASGGSAILIIPMCPVWEMNSKGEY